MMAIFSTTIKVTADITISRHAGGNVIKRIINFRGARQPTE
ncbi:hypothetical protein AB07_3834 [Citrobacter freundii]|nr:hypothetical protein AB07_3834 [Citrobacter freundii]